MPVNDMPKMLLEALHQHLTPTAAWLPWAVLATVAVCGLILMVKGARLAPFVACLLFAVAGGAGGASLPNLVAVPLWPCVLVCGTVGLILGLLLFRLWMALLLATCFLMAGLGVYSDRALREPLKSYLSRGFDPQQQLVTLKDAAEPGAAATTAQAELAGLWSHLSGSVPSFQASFYTILAVTLAAGLVLGLLLPKVARAIWGASLGTLLFAVAAAGLAHRLWPSSAPALGQWSVVVVTLLWCASLLFNLADMYHWRLRKPAPAPTRPAAA